MCFSVSLNIRKNNHKNRNRLDIVRDMLSVASVRVRKTRIMYQANLSCHQVEKYLNGLLERGLVERDGSCYLVTWKGKEFLQMYAGYLERCRRITDEVNGTAKYRLLLESMCINDEGNSKRMAIRKEVLA
jgi:predicted transcriptional regulator